MGPKLKLFVLLTCALLLGASQARAVTVYSYAGNNFNDVTTEELSPPHYTTSMSVTGSFTVAAPLISLSNQDITASILSFSFFDGIRTITSSNATSFSFTSFSTDAFGNITAWTISVDIGSLAAAGDEAQTIATVFAPAFGIDQGDIDFCVVFNGSSCLTAANVGRIQSSATVNNSGVWSETPLPAALPLFATGLGGLGLLGWRRKRKARAVA